MERYRALNSHGHIVDAGNRTKSTLHVLPFREAQTDLAQTGIAKSCYGVHGGKWLDTEQLVYD